MGVRDLINKFTSGELDPKFFAEVDYDGYRKSGRKLRNVVCIPQGGVTRRFGTLFQTTIMNNISFVTDPNQVRLIEYEHANDEFYDIIIKPNTLTVVAFDIYLAGVFQTSVPAPAATYTTAMIRDIRWVKDYDRLIILHKNVEPYELRRIAANNWQLNLIKFQFFPTYDFSSQDNPAMLPTPNVPYTSNTVTFTINATAATMVTASTAVFTSNHVGGLFYANSGIFRIRSINAAGTVATGIALEDFTLLSVPGDLTSLLEVMWNDGHAIGGAPIGINRGWPGHGSFYQSRLVLGSTPSLPGIAAASVVKEYYNFDDAQGIPSDGWSIELGVTGNDVITDILATKSLVLTGNKGPASTSILLNEATTPANAFVNTQGTEGSRNVNAVIIDNQVIYPDRAGNTIWSMSYDIPDTGYNIANASILSSQLIRGPRWADIFDPDDIDGRYYLLVNSDGTMAIYHTIRDENIKAWTLALTNGSFIDVACTANQAKVLTRRKVNTDTVIGGSLSAAYSVDGTFTAFRNKTIDVNLGNPVTWMVNNLDYMLIGSEIPFTALSFVFGGPGGLNAGLVFSFLDNTQNWEVFTPTDGTAGFTVNGNITWNINDVSDWQSQIIEGTDKAFDDLKPYYWIRIQRTNPTIVAAPVTFNIFENTQNRISMEKLDFNLVMDATITVTSDPLGFVSGLEHLAGQFAFFFANDYPIGVEYVSPFGSANITANNGNAIVTVGLDYTVNVTPMPVIALLQNGISVYEPSHIDFLYIDFYESLGITLGGQVIPPVVPGLVLADDVPQPVSDYYKEPYYGGWDPREPVVISQSYPAPMTILGISYTVEVSP